MDDPDTESAELLFAYGTLQLERVQLATFGRRLEDSEDHLVGYKTQWLDIVDPTVIEASGRSRHPILKFTGSSSDLVRGSLLRVTSRELLLADSYETADYKREFVTLGSGKAAWVYVDAREERPQALSSTNLPPPPKEGS